MKFDKKLFAEYLKQAKGDRSINKYAEECGVSSAHISRLMRQLLDTPPSPETIKKFTDKAYNKVTYYQLMRAAGHISDAINDFKEKIELILKKDNLSVEALAKKLGVNTTDLERTLNSHLTYDKYVSLVEQIIRNCSTEYFFDFSDLSLKNFKYTNSITDQMLDKYSKRKEEDCVYLPIVGVVRAGQPILADENIEGYYPTSNKRLCSGHEYFYLRVKGDSMNKEFPEGSLIMIKKQPTIENGDIAVVRINGDEATVKKIYIKDNIVTLVPMSTNPEYQPIIIDITKEDFEIIGKVKEAVKIY